MNILKSILNRIIKRKITSGIIIIALVAVSYFVFRDGGSAETRYVLAAVERGTIISSITGSGQVSALQQVDVKPKASGTLTYVGVKAGQEVYQGQVLAYLDSRDAQKSVRDAEINLESSRISLEKMRRSQTTGSETTTENLEQSYKDAYNKVSDSFLDLPNLIELARSVLYDNNVRVGGCYPNVCEYGNLAAQDFRFEFKQLSNRAEEDYKLAKDAFDPNFTTYRGIRLDAPHDKITSILNTTEKTTELLAQAVKSEQNMLDALVNNMNDEASKQGNKAQIPQQVITYQNNIGSTLSKLNSILSSLGNARRSIESATRSLEDAQLSNPIDLRSQENTVAQREASLQDDKDKLADYVIRAPFTGVVAKSDVSRGDSVSSGTTIATMLTKQSIAQISLNEVDIASVKIGQKVTLTFDAVEDLTITGQIVEVDSLGTVSQGVVSYGIKIGFDTTDERIKPGMTVTASVITDIKQNVLMIPNSAVKFAGGGNYVEIPNDTPNNSQLFASTGVILNGSPTQKNIEIGTANDSNTEVMSGLQEGDLIIVRTISSSTSTTQTTQGNSLFPSGGTRATGGQGGIRMQVR